VAIFGSLETVKKQISSQQFLVAFEYLTKTLDEESTEFKRLQAYELNVFEKIDLDEKNFALEQTYFSKDKDRCFFESHKQYIDVQCIVEGEEMIELENSANLKSNFPYNQEKDLIKYDTPINSSSLKLQKGDVAIFFPDDAHMPCIKVDKESKVIKTVVKVKID